ncbi:MAG: arylsulfatase [Chitinophagaceae bacterium]|nr:arylsulfatase [Chitinophagaceae bacterium]
MIRSACKVFIFGLLWLIDLPACAQQEYRKPNIILIVADDLGFGDIQPYGQKLIKTPNLSRLADEGMRFTQFYAGTSVCAPSRSSLMTGLHTGHTFIRGNMELEPEGQYPIPEDIPTFTSVLKKAGYTTGLFGKWGLGPVGSSGDPLLHGIDRFYGFNCQRQSHRYYPTHLWDNDRKVVLNENGNLQFTHTYAPDLIQHEAGKFLDEHAKEPFLLMLTYTLPHAELMVPDDSIFRYYKGKFAEHSFRGNDYGPKAKISGYASQDFPRATFAAMVTRLDFYVGEIMDKVEELGLSENTIIMFTSDNGPHREGGADPGFFKSSGVLRGLKRDLYEGGIRVPFIVRWPGKVKAGTVNDQVGAFWDIFPTLADLSGATTPSGLDGISLVPLLVGRSGAKHHTYLYWEFHEDGGKQAVRKGKWKAVRSGIVNNPNATIELFDLDKDPSEASNIAVRYPKVVKEMEKIMRNARVETNIFPLIPKR